jgi:hypothetical protein
MGEAQAFRVPRPSPDGRGRRSGDSGSRRPPRSPPCRGHGAITSSLYRGATAAGCARRSAVGDFGEAESPYAYVARHHIGGPTISVPESLLTQVVALVRLRHIAPAGRDRDFAGISRTSQDDKPRERGRCRHVQTHRNRQSRGVSDLAPTSRAAPADGRYRAPEVPRATAVRQEPSTRIRSAWDGSLPRVGRGH